MSAGGETATDRLIDTFEVAAIDHAWSDENGPPERFLNTEVALAKARRALFEHIASYKAQVEAGAAEIERLRVSRDEFRSLFERLVMPQPASPDMADVVEAVETWVNQRGGDETVDQIAVMAIEAYKRSIPDGGSTAEAQAKAGAEFIAELVGVLEAYEAAEGDIILTAEWSDDTPRITQSQFDRLVEIQGMRNAALSRARAKGGE